MRGKRAEAWFWSRLLLAIGIVLVLLVAALAWEVAGPMVGDTDTIGWIPILMPPGRFVAIAALALAIIGLVSMLRILRGPRDEPPPWRHRDR